MFVHMVSVSCVYNIVSRYTSVNLCFSLCVYQYVCVCLSMQFWHVSVGSCTEYVMCAYAWCLGYMYLLSLNFVSFTGISNTRSEAH